jgi:hypothetical protein
MSELVEIAPGRWRFVRDTVRPARSDLPCPHIVTDTMDPTEQIDGKFYTSKRAFRAVGRAAGLTEVGNEKLPPKRYTPGPGRREAIKEAFERYNSGQRPRPVKPID